MSYPSLSVKLPVPSGTYAIVSFSRGKVFIFSPLSRCHTAGSKNQSDARFEKCLYLFKIFKSWLIIQL